MIRRVLILCLLSITLTVGLDVGLAIAMIEHGMVPNEPGYGLTARVVWALIEGLAP